MAYSLLEYHSPAPTLYYSDIIDYIQHGLIDGERSFKKQTIL